MLLGGLQSWIWKKAAVKSGCFKNGGQWGWFHRNRDYQRELEENRMKGRFYNWRMGMTPNSWGPNSIKKAWVLFDAHNLPVVIFRLSPDCPVLSGLVGKQPIVELLNSRNNISSYHIDMNEFSFSFILSPPPYSSLVLWMFAFHSIEL